MPISTRSMWPALSLKVILGVKDDVIILYLRCASRSPNLMIIPLFKDGSSDGLATCYPLKLDFGVVNGLIISLCQFYAILCHQPRILCPCPRYFNINWESMRYCSSPDWVFMVSNIAAFFCTTLYHKLRIL